MKKKLVATAVAALAVVAALSGCAASTIAKIGPGQVASEYVSTPDGGKVLCVFWVPIDNTGVAHADGAQISCDWAEAGK